MRAPLPFLITVLLSVSAFAEIDRREGNNGNLVMEDVPEIPSAIVDGLSRYQNVRSAAFRAWSEDGEALYISTRFGDVAQLHKVDMPGGARRQVTFYEDPIGGVSRQPGGSKITFTRDAGGRSFCSTGTAAAPRWSRMASRAMAPCSGTGRVIGSPTRARGATAPRTMSG